MKREAVEDLIVRFAIAMLVAMAGFTVVWMMNAPRTPMGSVCRQSTPLTSLAASLRGQREAGCVSDDAPIILRPLYEKDAGKAKE